jgi:hypothetical protein
MTVRASQAWRWAAAAAVGIACLFASESGPTTQGPSLIAQANARTGRPVSHAGVARRTTRRAIAGGAVAGTIFLGYFGNSGGASSGYAPGGAYGGLGCYRNANGVLICP